MALTDRQRAWEKRLLRCGTSSAHRRTLDGVERFIAWENGDRASPMAPYATHLLDCKKWFEWTLNEHAARYGTNEWPGWAQLEVDFAKDPKMLRMIRQRLGVAS